MKIFNKIKKTARNYYIALGIMLLAIIMCALSIYSINEARYFNAYSNNTFHMRETIAYDYLQHDYNEIVSRCSNNIVSYDSYVETTKEMIKEYIYSLNLYVNVVDTKTGTTLFSNCDWITGNESSYFEHTGSFANYNYQNVHWIRVSVYMRRSFDGSTRCNNTYRSVCFLYYLRYAFIAFLVIGILLAAISFIYILSNFRREYWIRNIFYRFFKKLPTEILFAAILALCIMWIVFFCDDYSAYYINNFYYLYKMSMLLLALLFLSLLAINVVGRITDGTMKSGLITPDVFRIVTKSGTHTTRTAITVTLIVAALIVCIISMNQYLEIEYFLIPVVLIIIIYNLIKWCVMINRLNHYSSQLAAGEFHADINKKGMPSSILEITENLQSIGTVALEAVDERFRSEKMKTELVTNVSHDIKTPLTSIINYVDLLGKEQIDNDNFKKYLEVLQRQSSKMKRLIDDLIEASKAATGNLEIIPAKTDVRTLIAQTVGEFEDRAAASQLTLVYEPGNTPVYINIDGRRLFRIFDNLLSNACKYSLEGSRIFINVSVDDNVTIEFKNISRNQLTLSPQELTERFVRGDMSRNSDGSGLGLAIAKSLAELMNGSLRLSMEADLFKAAVIFPKYTDPDIQ